MWHGSALPIGRSSAIILAAAACVASIAPARAAADLSASATVGTEYNSNPIEISDEKAYLFSPDGIAGLDNFSKKLTATVAAKTADSGPLLLGLQGMYSHTEASRFDQLSHTDYNLDGTLDWKPGKVFDVSLEAQGYRSPITQADAGGEEVTQKTTRYGKATLRLHPTPEWQISLAPSWTHIDLPLLTAPDYTLHETARSTSLSYLGAGRFVPGLEFDQVRGVNAAIDDATRYRDRVVWGTLNYRTPGFSTLSLSLGRTQRDTSLVVPTNDPAALANVGKDSAFTGKLSYQRDLSVKTGITVSAYRDLDQYEAGVNTTRNTGFTGGVVWKPTRKISVTLDTDFVWSKINDLQVGGGIIQREDLTRSTSLAATYQVTRLVSLHPYITRSIRNSTFGSAQFNNTIAGLDLTATFARK